MMKKLLAVLLAAMTLLTLCGAALADGPIDYGYGFGSYSNQPAVYGPNADGSWTGEVISRQVTLYSKPKSSSEQIAKLKNGTQFDILDISGEYAHIAVENEYGGIDTGYVMYHYIIENPIHIVLRNNKNVYALAGPYAVNKRVGTLSNYQRFTVIAETGNYYIVSFREAVAFLPMSADYWIEESLTETLNGPSTLATVAYDKTKVYGYASTDYGKIDTFNAGMQVRVYYTANGFAAIGYDNVLAFIPVSDLIFQ